MAGFVFKVGGLDLSEMVRSAPGEGLAPYDPDVFQPQFSEGIGEGGKLVLGKVGLAERVFPLFLNDQDPEALTDLEIELGRILDEVPLLAEWRPPRSTDPVFWDVEAGRFEPDYNMRRSEKGWHAGILRLWTQPYGHTATDRLVAAATGAGVLITATLPALEGDAPADLRINHTLHSGVGDKQQTVVAVIPTSTYQPLVPAASLARISPAATVADNHWPGSVVIGKAFTTVQSYDDFPVCRATIVAGLYEGRNRVFAVARHAVFPDLKMWLENESAQVPIGPTQTVPNPYGGPGAHGGWELVDLGVLSIPAAPARPSAMKLRLHVGAPGATQGASPGLKLGALVILPEDRLTAIPSIIRYPDDKHVLDGQSGESWAQSPVGDWRHTTALRRGAIPNAPPDAAKIAAVSMNFSALLVHSVEVRAREQFKFSR